MTSTASDDWWAKRDAEVPEGHVRACPVCGQLIELNCWHEDTEEVSSEIMPKARAAALIRATIEDHQSDAARFQEMLDQLEAS